MIILAFETSCDDTSIALFRDTKLLCMETESQRKIHNNNGGVGPEVAARAHANSIFGVLETVLTKANLELSDIDYIAVTVTPGLIPSLLTGITVAKTLGNIHNKKVLEINHIEAHIFANYLERSEDDISYPLVCLTVS
jgi:N6-L-threonylcarbamoyladenine synthase